jgi:hypothetical protein
MEKFTEIEQLEEKILLLERQKKQAWIQFNEQIQISIEELQPFQQIKNSITNFTSSVELKREIIPSLISIAAGMLTNKLVVGKSKNPIQIMAGSIVQFGITQLLIKNKDVIQDKIVDVALKLIAPKNEDVEEIVYEKNPLATEVTIPKIQSEFQPELK